MDNIVLFKPKATLTAGNNLAHYIDQAKSKITLWSNFDSFAWDNHTWETPFRRIRFLNLESRQLHKTRAPQLSDLMSNPFGDFAKAYIRYTQHIKPTQTVSRSVLALQLLETAMIRLDGHALICDAQDRHFVAASELLLEKSIMDRSGVGNALEALGKHISVNKLTTHQILWTHSFVGKNANPGAPQNLSREQHEAKLPCSDAIWATAEIFANGYSVPQDDEDIFITSTTALLLSFPCRISELGYFRTVPYAYENNKNGEPELILKGFAPKTNKFMAKAVVETIAPITEEAVKRLQSITAEGRKLARHLESGSDKFYRHTSCPDVDDDAPLTPQQVTDALGFKSIGSTETFMLNNTGSYSVTGYTLNSLWQVVKRHNMKLNPDFPYQLPYEKGAHRLKMSEALMCLRYNQLSSTLSSSPVFLVPYNRDYYSKRMTSKRIMRGNKEISMSFFHKHNFGDISVNSHQFRHLLNTIAKEAGISIKMITEWSARASQQQTVTYMHEDPARTAKKIAENRIPAIQIAHNPITHEEYRNSRPKGPNIVTAFGICSHDYTVSYCNKFKDCLNCSELLLCKGHKRSIEAIEFERDAIKENLDAALADMKKGNRPADRWYDTHFMRYQGYLALLNVMTDPAIADGAVIKNIGLDFSLEQRIVEKVSSTPNSRPEQLDTSNLSNEVLEYMKFMMDENNASPHS
ncbi:MULTISPECIES: hypothetical protein [Pseudomonas]|uniref:Integrase n=1 Tax=Pseudomonas mosselii TaxID=78327 RepID=A0A5R8YZT2_9PSED|nr:hypothetical protein [Pseudomonas mosselii]TLP59009.1 hypothetical protein FEM01_13955 [Pseudomonas mosselii]